MKPIKLAIKDNNTAKQAPCGVCNEMFEPDWGLALFMADSYNPVCDKCGAKHSTELNRLLAVYRLFRSDILK